MEHKPLTPDEATAAGAEPSGVLDDAAATRLARRKLLKLGAYAAPLIVGTLAARKAQAATCAPCGPAECNPVLCGPPGCTPMQ